MPFRFSLNPVLRLRQSELRQQELALQSANEQVSRILQEIEIIDREIRSISQIAAGISGAELYFHHQQCEILSLRRLEALSRLNQVREFQAKAAEEFKHAWQRSEALETLRRRELESYAVEQTRREQRAQDDFFLQRKRMRSFLPDK